MTLKEAYDYLDSGVQPDFEHNKINRQVLKEIDYFKDFYKLQPKLYLSYDRFAYFEKMMEISELHLIKISRPEGKM